MRYIMLLQIKANLESNIEHKAVLLPERVVPSFDCGCLSEDDVSFWQSNLVEYKEIIKE